MFQFLRTFLEEEQAALVTLMLTSIPLSSLLRLLPNKYLILGLSIGASLLFQSIMFPTEKYFLWVQQHIVYILMCIVPRKRVGLVVTVESFIYLLVIQARRMYIAYGVNGIDITGILMMQVFMYIGLASNYQNGGKEESRLSEDVRRRLVKRLPNYL